mmetsp:Transcript_26355/g.87340  ORF Transcript_26355/g.87340 Transcript_26355/m.87340 type:complete len:283 (+) Transcript_26355:222-1070(+)
MRFFFLALTSLALHKWQCRQSLPLEQPWGLQYQAHGLHWPMLCTEEPWETSPMRASIGTTQCAASDPEKPPEPFPEEDGPTDDGVGEASGDGDGCTAGDEGVGEASGDGNGGAAGVTGSWLSGGVKCRWKLGVGRPEPDGGNTYCTMKESEAALSVFRWTGDTLLSNNLGKTGCASFNFIGGRLFTAVIGGPSTSESSESSANPSMKVFFTITEDSLEGFVNCRSTEELLEKAAHTTGLDETEASTSTALCCGNIARNTSQGTFRGWLPCLVNTPLTYMRRH